MRETCSCTAAMEITDVAQWSMEALVEVFASWRAEHRHEFPPEMAVVESSSSHERAPDEGFIEDRVPIGFARNPR